jgi:outer membrane protein assembly factor BamA
MKLILRFGILIVVIFFAGKLYAQQNNSVPITKIPVKTKEDSVKNTPQEDVNRLSQMDISDLIGLLLNRKPVSEIDSITTKPTVSVAPAIGYTLVSRLALVVSGNVAFRTGPQSRISNIVASTSYTQNKQFTLPVQTNIWSKDNNYNFIGDYRFYKYPQNTYGLGSSSDIKDVDPMDYSYFEFYETVLRHITGNLYVGAGYILDDHWNISDKGDLDGTVSDYSVYGKTDRSIASGFTINGLLDSRDNAINPTDGGYAAIQYRDNYEFLGSTSSWRSLIIDLRKYYKFPEGSDNVIALWSYDWLILSGKPGYLDLPSTHWDFNSATGRGYIQGRFKGAQMVYAEGEYRYKITNDGLIGGVVFLNAESLSAAPGTRLQAIQPGYGPGVRIKLNKVSNTNITIDYGFGSQGSNGLFINVGEAF